jgi:glutamine amidotransferase
VGWNLVDWKKDSILSKDLDFEERFYFTHSYAVECEVESESIGVTEYGYKFSSVVQKENIYGTQFHPEKSHLNGLKLLENFCKL